MSPASPGDTAAPASACTPPQRHSRFLPFARRCGADGTGLGFYQSLADGQP